MTDGAIDREGEVTELLQQLIRNACVNDGTVGVGRRGRAAPTCSPTYLEGPGLDLERYEPAPGRTSLVARIEGTDPTAPTLLLMGHTDVVPVNPERWRRDPFGGELVDGEVWGRGAVDMLNLTASMAVAIRRLARSRVPARRARSSTSRWPTRRRSASWGADHLVEHERDAVGADYVITESGGIPIAEPGGPEAARDRRREGRAAGGSSGSAARRARLAALPHRQRPRHRGRGRAPAGRVPARAAHPRRLAAVPHLDGLPRRDHRAAARPRPASTGCSTALPLGMARQFHACTHTTFAPTVIHGGTRSTSIPDLVELEVDIRTLPGETRRTVTADARRRPRRPGRPGRVRPVPLRRAPAPSPIDTPLWDSLAPVTQRWYAGSRDRALPHRRRHRRPLLPAGRHARPTASACSART